MREVSINQKKGVTDAERKELPFEKYKTTVLFWFLADQILDKLLDAQAITDRYKNQKRSINHQPIRI